VKDLLLDRQFPSLVLLTRLLEVGGGKRMEGKDEEKCRWRSSVWTALGRSGRTVCSALRRSITSSSRTGMHFSEREAGKGEGEVMVVLPCNNDTVQYSSV
jgi:hypothetical protein